jgi:hypothetical protein
MDGRTRNFDDSVTMDGECRIWTGGIDKELGFGYAYPGGKRTYAHRYAYERAHGPVPRTTRIEQTCGNKLCVRVEHLRIVTIETRVWEFVNKTETCWLWTGSKNNHGYGQLAVPGKSPQAAHRVIYELVKGPIPEGMNLLHTCPGGDNPACVNPDHLRPGNQRENWEDMVRNGTYSPPPIVRLKGEDSPHAKLTWPKVRAIRKMKEESRLSNGAIGEKFGVGRDTVRDIILFRTWVNDPEPVSPTPLASTYGHRH